MSRAGPTSSSRRGGALVTLGGAVAVWLVLRAAIWEAPFAPASLAALPLGDVPAVSNPMPLAEPPVPVQQASPAYPIAPVPVLPAWNPVPLALRLGTDLPPEQISFLPQLAPGNSPLARRGFAGASNLVAHVLLLQAGYRGNGSAEPLSPPANFAQADGNPQPTYVPHAAEAMRRDPVNLPRWSMDAWAMWRQDDPSPLLSGRPSYGRSQAGAVLRYHLAPASGHAPQLHLRGSVALEGLQEREAAFGGSARPIPGVPVRLAAEARVSETDRGTEARAAAYAVTELAPVRLPGGFSGEVYAQGGYVSGNFATPFVDGQARITRELAGSEDFRLEAGGGAWGGAQEDARRLDVGPSAAVSFRVGAARGRISADYRFRVAGDAKPASGPALTLSAGF
ncbi:MAG: hypothetical protein JY451_08595 [Erythrobacter sp.]|nr:MAG: hypothetical protein JY451_08595 [Erythrobacter sp.]